MERQLTFAQALKEGLRQEMERDQNVILLGEDIKYSVWGVTGGLNKEFGDDRVLHVPISENGFVSAAIGSAMTGLRPVVELMYSDFLLMSADAVVVEAAKYRYMNGGGGFKVPLTIRAAGAGAATGSGPHHSQDVEATFIHYPGLKVVYPSTPFDAKGLLVTAIRDENPVIFFEHKLSYAQKGHVPEELYSIPFGQADIVRKGEDVTLVTWGPGRAKAIKAAEELSKEGIQVEIIDPRTLEPFDKDTVLKSLEKTGKLVVLEDGCKKGGFGAEIAGIVAEEAIELLDGPVKRLGAAHVNIPSSRYGEKFIIPSVEDIISAIKSIV
ncbi:MAG: pyruvate dehydrogenase subunit beta [Clostridiales bacterium]|jgi:pyruvate dehydrogenase E1 component beta subunit|nr:pyruvate dehydrogenase subunit beta [Clostridiales bacterium]